MDYSYLDRNVAEVREQISLSQKGDGQVTLLAAIKGADVDEVNYLHRSLGVSAVGENRVQQLLERYDRLDDDIELHFIGQLQSNKVKYIIDKVSLIHSLDSQSLAKEIDKQAKKRGIVMRVLVEINIGREESKGGIMPEDAEAFARLVEGYEGIKLCGFMTMAPKGCTKQEYLRYFGEFHALATDIWTEKLGRAEEPIISMGMSDSYCEAVACGSNLVRIGSQLFRK